MDRCRNVLTIIDMGQRMSRLPPHGTPGRADRPERVWRIPNGRGFTRWRRHVAVATANSPSARIRRRARDCGKRLLRPAAAGSDRGHRRDLSYSRLAPAGPRFDRRRRLRARCRQGPFGCGRFSPVRESNDSTSPSRAFDDLGAMLDVDRARCAACLQPDGLHAAHAMEAVNRGITRDHRKADGNR